MELIKTTSKSNKTINKTISILELNLPSHSNAVHLLFQAPFAIVTVNTKMPSAKLLRNNNKIKVSIKDGEKSVRFLSGDDCDKNTNVQRISH